MDSKKKVNDSSSSSLETSIITLIPCEYESSDEDDNRNESNDSIDSSELVDSSDDENEPTKIEKISPLDKRTTGTKETKTKNDEIVCD